MKYNRIGGVALLEGEYGADERRFNLETKSSDFLKSTSYEGLNFRFNFSYKCEAKQGVRGLGTVGILGLTRETIKKWASAEFYQENVQKRRFLRVYAGYEDEGNLEDCELFTMAYTGAMPTSPPEMWLNFNGQDGSAALSSKVVDVQGMFYSGFFQKKVGEDGKKSVDSWQSSAGISLKQACESICRQMKMDLKWHISKYKEKLLPRLRGFDFNGTTVDEAVEEINSWGLVWARASWYARNDGTRDGQRAWYQRLDVHPNFDEAQFDTSIKEPVTLSEETGMIGLPHYGTTGDGGGGMTLTVKSLLRRDVGVGDLIRVESKFIDSPRPFWRVNEVRYEGEFRGQSWYTTYVAQNQESMTEEAENAKRKAEEEKRAQEEEREQQNKVWDAVSANNRLR